MASKIVLSRSISRLINCSVFTKQRRGFCDVYPEKSRSWPPESVLAKYHNMELPVGSPIWRFLNRSEPPPPPPPPQPTTLPDSTQHDLLPGQDFKHYFVAVVSFDSFDIDDRDAIIDSFIKLLAQVVGSEEEAKKRIYSVSTKYRVGFSAILPEEEYRQKLDAMPDVGLISMDAYEDVENKRYPGEPFVDGKAVPYDPKYHERLLAERKRDFIMFWRIGGRPPFVRDSETGKLYMNFAKPRGWRRLLV